MVIIAINCHTDFQSGWIIAHTHQQPGRHVAFRLPHKFFGIVTIFCCCCSYGCVALIHYGLNLHFPDGWWCWTSFYVLIYHFYIFFGGMFLFAFVSFSNWIVIFCLLLSFESSLRVLDISLLRIFSPSLWSVFLILLTRLFHRFFF